MKFATKRALRVASRVALSLGLAALAGAWGATDLVAQNGQVVGRIVGPNGQSIEFAAVQWEGQDGWSAARADGGYTLVVPAGTRTILAQALGYRTARQTVQVPANETVTVDFTLATRPLDVAGVTVSVLRPDLTPATSLEDRELREANPKDTGELLRAMDGVDAVRRGPLGLDPVVRGLRETEVGTYLDGTRLFPAGPARMDSPLTHLDPSAVRSLEVVKGPYALTWGAGNLSAIRVETQPLPELVTRPRGSVSAGYDSNLRASESALNVRGRSGLVSYTIDGAVREGKDYEAGGDGTVVPGDFDSWDVRGKLGIDVGENGQVVLTAGYQDQGPIDYPGRLLTAESFESPNFSGAFEWAADEGTLTGLEVRAYRNRVTHMMSNREKPSRLDAPAGSMRMPPFALDITVDSEITVWGGRAAAELDLGGPWSAEVGGDAYSANRDATRFINRLSTGMPVPFSPTRMWPDATVTDVGGFGRLAWREGSVSVSGTARLDIVRADAPMSEVDQFFLDNNPAGSDLDASETNLSGAVTASFDLDQNWVLSLGVGSAVRTADATERYSDRIPATKAQFAAEFLGDPQLDPERSTQGDLWVDGRYENFSVHLGAFARKITDYITIEQTTLPAELPLTVTVFGQPNVFQYINGEATFYGLEGSASVGLTDEVTASASGSYLYGQDDQLDEPAIGVAPLKGSLGLRYEEPGGRFYVEGIVNAVAEQDRVSTSRNEAVTPGYQTGDVRAGVGLSSGVTLRGGVLNLWDEAYTNHLNARNPFGGIPVPEPGRVFFVDVAVAF